MKRGVVGKKSGVEEEKPVECQLPASGESFFYVAVGVACNNSLRK